MNDEAKVDPSCAVCGRRLLPGERVLDYVTREGAEATVCELCKSRAEAAGWMRPEEAARLRESGEGRERRRQRGQILTNLRARAERMQARRTSAAETAAERTGPRSRPRERPRPERSQAPGPEQAARPRAAAAGLTLAEALAAFNASEARRTVGGLNRSLGEPRASGLAVRTNSGAPGARLTVAWELAWYQWEVGPGERGPQIRQASKGEEIDQLRAADRTWNLAVAEDGSLSKKAREPSGSEAEAEA